jgi:hypothetical protein
LNLGVGGYLAILSDLAAVQIDEIPYNGALSDIAIIDRIEVSQKLIASRFVVLFHPISPTVYLINNLLLIIRLLARTLWSDTTIIEGQKGN